MEPCTIELPDARQGSAGELWRIHVDLDVDPSLTTDGRQGFHTCDNVSKQDAEAALAVFRDQHGDGIGFAEPDGSRSWFYPWAQVLDLRIMPMREAI